MSPIDGQTRAGLEERVLGAYRVNPHAAIHAAGTAWGLGLFRERRAVARAVLENAHKGEDAIAEALSRSGLAGRLPVFDLDFVATLTSDVRALVEMNGSAADSGDPQGFDLSDLSISRHLAAEVENLERGVQRCPTGWPRVDAATGGGFAVPSLNIIGAAPKSGKSTWVQHVAEHHLSRGGAVLYVDLENGRRRFLRQFLCRKAGLGAVAVAAALESERAGVFTSRADVERWQGAKTWVGSGLPMLWVAFKPPGDWQACLRAVRAEAGTRQLMVCVDSLQKLPGDLAERRAVVDSWIRLFEALRHELDAVFVVVSEIKRGREGYRAGEDAFKESGGIEYAADLAMTMDRASAEEGEEAVSTLRIELARDCDEDPRGDVASYAPVRPHYGLEERDPAPRREKRRSGPRATARASAEDFLRERLAAGPVAFAELKRAAGAEGFSESTLQRAKREMGLIPCTLNLKTAWRLP